MAKSAFSQSALKDDCGKKLERGHHRALTVIDYNPTLSEAHQLLANVYAAAKRFGEAQKEGLRWQETSTGDANASANATQLIAPCRALATKLDPMKTTETETNSTH